MSKVECRKTHAFNVVGFGSANASWSLNGPARSQFVPAGRRAFLHALQPLGTTDLDRDAAEFIDRGWA
jgi:hypothetical protein